MDGLRNTKRKRMLYLLAVFVMILITISPTATYAADHPLKLTVKHTFTTTSDSAYNMFTYRLTPLSPGNPMPAGSTADGYTFSIAGSDNVEIDMPDYAQPGIYRYELAQVIGEEKPGYTYDKQVYTIEVHVNEALGVDFIVFDDTQTKVADIAFENGYRARATDPNLMPDPPVMKTVSGNPSSNGTFTFKLTAQNASQPMPAGSVNGVKTIQIVGQGEGEFGTWSYDKEGVYYYKVSEVNAGEAGYTYDTSVYTITDKVSESNGQLVLSRVVTNNMNKQVTSCSFINKYTSEGTTPDKEGPKQGGAGPKTGDNMNITLYVTLLVLGGILTAGAAVCLIVGEKRKWSFR